MSKRLRFSELIGEIDDVIQDRFSRETFWITSEITDLNEQPDKSANEFLTQIQGGNSVW